MEHGAADDHEGIAAYQRVWGPAVWALVLAGRRLGWRTWRRLGGGRRLVAFGALESPDKLDTRFQV